MNQMLRSEYERLCKEMMLCINDANEIIILGAQLDYTLKRMSGVVPTSDEKTFTITFKIIEQETPLKDVSSKDKGDSQ